MEGKRARSPSLRPCLFRCQSVEAEELRQYLLQLVQALRYEAVDGSRLARFLVARAAEDPPLAIQLHWWV